MPELGRIWFVRQLSWPLAALALHDSINVRLIDRPPPSEAAVNATKKIKDIMRQEHPPVNN